MANVFAFAESRGGALRKRRLEAVTAARALADATGGGEVHALLAGAPGIAALAPQLGQYGADVVIVVEHAALANANAEALAATAAERDQGWRLSRGDLRLLGAQGRDLASARRGEARRADRGGRDVARARGRRDRREASGVRGTR